MISVENFQAEQDMISKWPQQNSDVILYKLFLMKVGKEGSVQD